MQNLHESGNGTITLLDILQESFECREGENIFGLSVVIHCVLELRWLHPGLVPNMAVSVLLPK